MGFWVYILKCADNSYYTGHTDDLEVRLAQHETGEFPDCYTFKRRPLTLFFAQETHSREQAVESEMQIKKWSRAKKEALAASNWEQLSKLAKRHGSRRSLEQSSRLTPHHQRFDNDSLEQSSRLPPSDHGEEASRPQVLSRLEPHNRFDNDSLEQSENVSEPQNESLLEHYKAEVHWMQRALALADRAEQEDDEVPVGALIIDSAGELLAEAWNQNIKNKDPSAHAEILAMRAAGEKIGNHRLLGCTLYVTLEPCAMCAMAMIHARIKRVVFAATDPKTGAAGSVFDLLQDTRHNHRIEVQGGVLAEVASKKLSDYFRAKRQRV
jgi:tRNA(Arg) A34 adenosine deaminase TadA/predicted GIY-YIG superfamily endonuclease